MTERGIKVRCFVLGPVNVLRFGVLFAVVTIIGCGSAASPTVAGITPVVNATPRPELELVKPDASPITSSLGFDLLLIQPGRFLMGADAQDSRAQPQERPLHIEEIKDAFFLGVYEVTQDQYQSVMKTNPSCFCPKGEGGHLVGGARNRIIPC